jgi:DNA helicase HerA-like ATPase
VGEALVSFLDEKGTPRIVERAWIVPPGSQIGPISDAQRQQTIQQSSFFAKYKTAVDRESAYERLTGRTEKKFQPAEAKPAEPAASNPVSDVLFGKTGPRGGKQSQGLIEAMAKSAARTVGSSVGREIVRGILGSILGAGSKRRR